MGLAGTIALMGKRWSIIEKLSKRKYYVSELAREFKKSAPEISINLKELERNGLLEFEQKEGERRKYYYLSDYANRIFRAVTQVTQVKPKERFEGWQMNEFLSILEDQDLSDDLRLVYSESFYRICREYPMVISHKKVRDLFERVAKDPFRDKVRKSLMRSISAILPHALQNKKWTDWVLTRLYPIFHENMDNEDERIRVWGIGKIGRIASFDIEPLKHKAKEEFLHIWFSNDTDPDSELGRELKRQLMDLSSKQLFEDVRAKTKNKNKRIKAKAETLLDGLKECLMPESARKVESRYCVTM